MCIAAEDYENLCSIRDYWAGKTMMDLGEAFKPDCLEELAALGADDYGGPQSAIFMIPAGHLTPGFPHIINKGYGAIKKQATDWIEAHTGNLMGEDMDKYMFYRAVEITCDAATTLVRRYGEEARWKAAGCADPARKA